MKAYDRTRHLKNLHTQLHEVQIQTYNYIGTKLKTHLKTLRLVLLKQNFV